jgi:hypothetical protein
LVSDGGLKIEEIEGVESRGEPVPLAWVPLTYFYTARKHKDGGKNL